MHVNDFARYVFKALFMLVETNRWGIALKSHSDAAYYYLFFWLPGCGCVAKRQLFY